MALLPIYAFISANSGRKIYLVFDQETKPKTQQAVNLALQRMGYLFSQANCEVKVVTWDAAEMLPGENWANNIGKALQESEAMIVGLVLTALHRLILIFMKTI